MKIYLSDIQTSIKHIVLPTCLFFYIYSIVLGGPLSTGRIVTLFLMVYVSIFRLKSFIKLCCQKEFAVYYALIMITFAYACIIYAVNNKGEIFFFTIYMMRLTEYFFPILIFILLYRDMEHDLLFRHLVIVITLQSVFVLMSFGESSFKQFVDSVVPYISNLDQSSFRLRGFSNSSGATLSLVQGIGGYVAVLMFYKSKTLSGKTFYLFLVMINLLALVFIGRTGIVLLLGGAVFMLIYIGRSKNLKAVLSVSVILFILITNVYTSLPKNQRQLLSNRVLPWAFELFINMSEDGSAATDSTQVLNNMLFLPESFKVMVFGEGISLDRSNYNYSRTDSGFVRYIFYFGLVGTVMILLPFAYLFSRMRFERLERHWYIYLVLTYLFFNIKEPFLWKPQSFPLFLLITFYLVYKGKLTERENNIQSGIIINNCGESRVLPQRN